MKAFGRCCAAMVVLLCIVSASAVNAQQPATGRKRVPTLTTDDVYAQRSVPQAAEATEEPANKPATPGVGGGGKAATGGGGKAVSPEESAWRESVRSARERVKDADR